jgi:hypothetical protein
MSCGWFLGANFGLACINTILMLRIQGMRWWRGCAGKVYVITSFALAVQRRAVFKSSLLLLLVLLCTWILNHAIQVLMHSRIPGHDASRRRSTVVK